MGFIVPPRCLSFRPCGGRTGQISLLIEIGMLILVGILCIIACPKLRGRLALSMVSASERMPTLTLTVPVAALLLVLLFAARPLEASEQR